MEGLHVSLQRMQKYFLEPLFLLCTLLTVLDLLLFPQLSGITQCLREEGNENIGRGFHTVGSGNPLLLCHEMIVWSLGCSEATQMIWPNLGHQDHAVPGGKVGIDVHGEAEIPGMVLEGVLRAKHQTPHRKRDSDSRSRQ